MGTTDNELVFRFHRRESFFQRDRFEIIEPLAFEDIEVEPGFISDATSSHWTIQWIVPQLGKGAFAAIIHDKAINVKTWREAAAIYQRALVASGFSITRAYVHYAAVMLWGIYNDRIGD